MYFQRRELPSSISIILQELSSKLHKPRVSASLRSSLFQFNLFTEKTEKKFKLRDACSRENQNRHLIDNRFTPGHGIKITSLFSYLMVSIEFRESGSYPIYAGWEILSFKTS